MTTLILVRHGQSEANRQGLFAGHSDFPLSELGRYQAEKTAEYILENYKLDAIYSSDLKRAYETALPISRLTEIDIITDERLREIYAGDWESLTFDTIAENFSQDRFTWVNDIGNSRCTNGESVIELSSRIFSRLTELAEQNDGKTVLITFHATPIRAMQTLWQYGTLDDMKTVSWVPNASVSVAEYENGRFIMRSVGAAEHLSNLVTLLPPNV